MSALARPATTDGLVVWVMHRFAALFDRHAVLKGGMSLRLLDSPRSTTDIDYVFVPYRSKREVRRLIEEVLGELEDASYEIDLHSKMLRARLRVDEAEIQIEVNVALECPTVAMATGGFARSQGQPSQVVAIMEPSRALSEKLAAWNERRLLRDLYDCYFLSSRLGARLDPDRLDDRLSKIESRNPRLRRTKSMSRRELARELSEAALALDQENVDAELLAVLPPEELAGLALRLRASIAKIAEQLASSTG